MTFSSSTISRITEELRFAQEQVITLERETEAARASVAEWSNLLSYAETNPGQPPAEPVVEPVDAVPNDQGPGWCACGLPGVGGVTHSLDGPCVTAAAGTQAIPFDELMGRAQEKVRGHFEPYAPPAASTDQPGGQP
ncbi:hypothetical protein [Streptosporangium sp. G12]